MIQMVTSGMMDLRFYYQDHDNDGMATGWEFHFKFDPQDAADRMVDTDGDGHVNFCEYKWDTNPRSPLSYPGQGELCNPFEGIRILEKLSISC